MQEACEEALTSLVSIHGLSEEAVMKNFDKELVQVALINSPEIIVVGCPSEDVEFVSKLAEEIGATRISALPTQGAFHTNYMLRAAQNFLGVHKYDFSQPRIAVVTNTTGEIEENPNFLRHGLFEGMILPVQWAKTIKTLREQGVTEFIEVGPGNSLAILNRKNGIDRSQTRNILD